MWSLGKGGYLDPDDDPFATFEWTNISCILEPEDGVGGLYLGNLNGAKDVKKLKECKVTAVLTVAAQAGLKYTKKDFEHKIIPAEDSASFNLLKHFDEALEFMTEHMKKGSVYVHCFAGISRSATIVIAYLMKENGWPMEAAFKFVIKKRNIISPNPGFERQLETFEKKLTREKEDASKGKKEP